MEEGIEAALGGSRARQLRRQNSAARPDRLSGGAGRVIRSPHRDRPAASYLNRGPLIPAAQLCSVLIRLQVAAAAAGGERD